MMISLLLTINLLANINFIDTSEVKSIIYQKYYQTLPDSVYAMPWIDFSKYLDSYTRILDEAEYSDFGDNIDGVIRSSIGMYVDSNQQGFEVIKVMPEGSAYKSGIARGDILLSIDDVPLVGYIDLASYLIDVSRKNAVFKIKRGFRTFEIEIAKSSILKNSIYSCRYNNTVVIDIHKFTTDVALQFAFHSRRMSCETADTLIIDLRGNPGGLLHQALMIADEFVDGNQVMLKTKARVDSSMYYSTPGGLWTNVKKIIIVQDSQSASASEVLAGIVKYYTNAEVIGTRSYGKGVVQEQVAIRGGALFVTISEYFLAGSVKIHGIGIPVTRGCRLIKTMILPDTFDYVKFRSDYRRPTIEALCDPRIQGMQCVGHLIWEDYGTIMEMILQNVYN